MDDQRLLKLRAQLTAKKIQIQAFVAKKHGMGALRDLSQADFKRVEDLTDGYLEIWEEAYHEGHPAAQGEETFNTLARECHEIQKQIDADGSS
jgi:hypothetical protein